MNLRFVRVASALIIAMAAATVAACGSTSRGTSTGASVVPTVGTASDSAAAIRTVIQKANQEEQQAFDQDNPSLMRATATAAYYAQLVRLDTTLRGDGVTAIQLRSIAFGDIGVQGNSAQATTSETWQANYAGGSSTVETTTNIYTLVLVRDAWKISSDTVPHTNIPPSSTSPSTAASPSASPRTPSNRVGSMSRNWAGYVAVGSGFTAISGTWTVPTVAVGSGGTDATWVGIGGATTTDLIQAGTQAVVDSGAVEYAAWIEQLPQASQTVPLAVHAGDTITVSITAQLRNAWTISIVDATSGGTYTGTVIYASSESSVEWIEEAPSSGRGVLKLDQFGTVNFSSDSAVESGQKVTPGAAGAKAVTMVSGSGTQLAAPSALGAGGSSFSVTRT